LPVVMPSTVIAGTPVSMFVASAPIATAGHRR
jgi:hypothetical protein